MKSCGLQTLPIAAIDLGERLRPIDHDWAVLLAQNIAATGLQQPVQVRKKPRKEGAFILVSGGHRLEAVREHLGWTEIPAYVLETTEIEARILEIDENLVRHELNPFDRAIFLAERARLHAEAHPETVAGVAGARGKLLKNGATANVAIAALHACFAAEVRERTGLSERSVRRSLLIAHRLAPDVRLQLRGTAIAKNQRELEQLSKLPHPVQRGVVARLLAPGSGQTTVGQALAVLTAAPLVPDDADKVKFDRLSRVWKEASVKVRRQFLAAVRHDVEALLSDLDGEADEFSLPSVTALLATVDGAP